MSDRTMLDRNIEAEISTSYGRTATSTSRLLTRLVKHHCYNMRLPQVKVDDKIMDPVEPPPSPPKSKPRHVSGLLTVATIRKVVADHFNLEVETLVSPSRHAKVLMPRFIAIYLTRMLRPELSLPMIGRKFGNRDHTTCLSAVRKVERYIRQGHHLANDIEIIRKVLLHVEAPNTEASTPVNLEQEAAGAACENLHEERLQSSEGVGD